MSVHCNESQIGSNGNYILTVNVRIFMHRTTGTIDRAELQRGFEMLGLQMDRAQIVKVMADYQDADDKDTLSKEEYAVFYKLYSTIYFIL